MNPVQLQKQIRDNASDLESYLKDLDSWKDEMKRKELELMSGSDETSAMNIPPPRKVQKASAKGSTEPSKVEKNPQKLKSYDYAAWDKFDVEAECKKIEENENGSGGPSSSGEESSDDEDEEQQLRDEAVYEKEKGNNFVKLGRWKDAIECYSKAIENFKYDPIFYANRALCYLKLEEYKNAETDCTTALQMDKTYVKAYQRRAVAREKLKQISEAICDLKQVVELEPKNSAAKNTINRLEKLVPKESLAKMSLSTKSVPGTSGIKNISQKVDDIMAEKKCAKPAVAKIESPKTNKISQKTKTAPETQKINWPLGEQVTPIKLIKKPPHQRSKKPLKKITIQQVEYSSADSNDDYKTKLLKDTFEETVLKKSPKAHLIEIIDAEENTKEEETKEKDTEASQDIKAQKTLENDRNILPSTSKINDCSKVDAQQKQQQQATKEMDLPVPKSSVQFYADWKLLHNKVESKCTYLRNIPPANIPNIFKESLESDLFTEILETMAEFFLKTGNDVYSYLKSLSEVKRFSTLTLFMSSKDKSALQKIFRHLEETEKHRIDEINVLIKKYEL